MMTVDIELTRRANDTYTARALQFPDVIVEAASRDSALARIREALIERRRSGAEIIQLSIDDGNAAPQPTWPRHAGDFPDDETYQSMLAEVERQRRAPSKDDQV
jgi:hypothetical protein